MMIFFILDDTLGDLDYFLMWLAGYRAIPMVHWYLNGAIGTNRKGHHSNGSIGEYASH